MILNLNYGYNSRAVNPPMMKKKKREKMKISKVTLPNLENSVTNYIILKYIRQKNFSCQYIIVY